MEALSRFIVIDDDLINNLLCRMAVAESGLEIKTFNVPETGFEYISEAYGGDKAVAPTILFLDINMPTWTGWDFLKNFERLDEKIKNQIKIYMLSSSVDIKDRERAFANNYVVDYIVKPINSKIVSGIFVNAN